MAATAISNTVLTRNTAAAVPAAATVAANLGALVTYDKQDQKILLLLKNNVTNATNTAVIVKGNGLQGTADLEVTLAASAEKAIVIESGKYVNVSGDDKGKITVKDKVTTTTTIEVRAIVLP